MTKAAEGRGGRLEDAERQEMHMDRDGWRDLAGTASVTDTL